jgi:hypothetical protein
MDRLSESLIRLQNVCIKPAIILDRFPGVHVVVTTGNVRQTEPAFFIRDCSPKQLRMMRGSLRHQDDANSRDSGRSREVADNLEIIAGISLPFCFGH